MIRALIFAGTIWAVVKATEYYDRYIERKRK